MEVRFIARRDLQTAGFDFGVAIVHKPGANSLLDAIASEQKRTAIFMT